MILVTSCPECKTTFRISVGILEKAGGQVRCGRCARIFDANAKLREVDESEVEAKPAPAFKFELQPDPEVGSPESFEALKRPLSDDALQEHEGEPHARDDDNDAHRESDVVHPESDELPESGNAPAEAGDEPTGRDDAISEPEDALPEPVDPLTAPDDPLTAPDDPLTAPDDPLTAPDDPLTAPDDPLTEPDTEPGAAAAPHAAAEQPAQESPEMPHWLLADREPKPARTRLWVTGVALATVALVGQLVHHYREELAAQPAIGAVLSLAYAGFGTELRPSVDLGQYELRDLTAVAEPSDEDRGWLVIETRVRNSGPAVQPYPHIFVRLLDRWEDTVAARYFAPEEYAVTSIPDIDRMNAGSTIDAQFIIMDPGPSATGFELELCIESTRGLECESDAVDD